MQQHYYKVHDVIKYTAKHRGKVNSNNGGREQIISRVHTYVDMAKYRGKDFFKIM